LPPFKETTMTDEQKKIYNMAIDNVLELLKNAIEVEIYPHIAEEICELRQIIND
jgi:hypothetical protein